MVRADGPLPSRSISITSSEVIVSALAQEFIGEVSCLLWHLGVGDAGVVDAGVMMALLADGPDEHRVGDVPGISSEATDDLLQDDVMALDRSVVRAQRTPAPAAVLPLTLGH